MKMACGGTRAGWGVALLVLAACSGGCGTNRSELPAGSDEQAARAVSPAISLNILVVDDTRLAPVMARQYSARQNATLNISETTWPALVDSQFADCEKNDVIVFPARRLGELTSRQIIRPLDLEDLSGAESRRSVFYFDRQPLVTWHDQTMGVSLGQSLPVLLCRQDVLTACQVDVPTTWTEFSELAKKISASDAERLPSGIGIPLAGHWASQMLMVRAAPAIRARGRYSALFDVTDMRPLIDSEPFLRLARLGSRNRTRPASGFAPRNPATIYVRRVGHGDHSN